MHTSTISESWYGLNIHSDSLGEGAIQLVLYLLPLNANLAEHEPWISRLQKWTAVVPVVAKADLFSGVNVQRAKSSFVQRSKEAGIQWYDIRKPLKELLPGLGIEVAQGALGACPPFWNITANKGQIGGSRQVLYRETLRGVFLVTDPGVSDFKTLYIICAGGLQPALTKHAERLRRMRDEIAQRKAGQKELLVKFGWILGITGTIGGLAYLLRDTFKSARS
jgi:hypothetical protein